MSSLPPEDDQLLQIRQAIARLFESIGRIESRLDSLESGTPPSPAQEPLRRDEPLEAEVLAESPPPEPQPPEQPTHQSVPAREPSLQHVVGPITIKPPAPADEEVSSTPTETPAFEGLATSSLPPSITKKLPNRSSWESEVGGRWMTWMGAGTLIVAMAFTIHWAWSTFHAPDWLKVSAFHLLGVGLLAGGHFLNRRELKVFAEGLAGLGIFTLFGIAFAALHLYEIWGESVAFVESAAITLVAVTVAIRARSVTIILLGALGGYLTPLVTSTGSGNYLGWFTYLAFLNVALIGCTLFRSWSFLKPLTLVATAAMFGIWVESSHFTSFWSEKVWATEWLVVLHFVIFLVGTTVPPLAWKRRSDSLDLMALVGSSLWFVGMTWFLFRERTDQQLAMVCWAMALVHLGLFGWSYQRLTNSDRMPRFQLALAVILFTLAVPLQLNDMSFLAATWCVEGLVFTAVGLYFRDAQMKISSLAVFLLAAARLIGWDFPSDPRLFEGTTIDLRCFMFVLFGLSAVAAAMLHRSLPQILGPETEPESRSILDTLNLDAIPQIQLALAAIFLVLAPLLQLQDMRYLSIPWGVQALAFVGLGVWFRDWLAGLFGLIVFALAGLRLLGLDFHSNPQLLADTAIDLRFFLFLLFGLFAGLAGTACCLLSRRSNHNQQEALWWQRSGGVLLALANVMVLLGMICQWDDHRLVLTLWTLDAAAILALGFALRSVAVRSYGLILAVLMVGARTIYHLPQPVDEYNLLLNTRFLTMALVAGLYFVAGWWYRRSRLANNLTSNESLLGDWANLQKEQKDWIDPFLGILANAVLVVALSLEIHSWFRQQKGLGNTPFPNMKMAEQASYSIVWAVYAALVVLAGFLLRYRLFRLIGLIAFAPILAKVFFVDLANLQLLPRVLALAVLGMMLLGVSFLYQKFSGRVSET